MKESIAAKLAALERRLKEIDAKLADPEVTNDLDNYRKLSQERSELEPVVASFGEWRKAQDDVTAAEDMAKDPQMRDFAQEEILAARARPETISSCANSRICGSRAISSAAAMSSWALRHSPKPATTGSSSLLSCESLR